MLTLQFTCTWISALSWVCVFMCHPHTDSEFHYRCTVMQQMSTAWCRTAVAYVSVLLLYSGSLGHPVVLLITSPVHSVAQNIQHWHFNQCGKKRREAWRGVIVNICVCVCVCTWTSAFYCMVYAALVPWGVEVQVTLRSHIVPGR